MNSTFRQLLLYLREPLVTAAPMLHNIVQYDLGSIAGIALGFTDATEVFGLSKLADRYVLTILLCVSNNAICSQVPQTVELQAHQNAFLYLAGLLMCWSGFGVCVWNTK